MNKRKKKIDQPRPTWHPSFTPFGDRLEFLSGEKAHLASGRLSILPAKEREPRG